MITSVVHHNKKTILLKIFFACISCSVILLLTACSDVKEKENPAPEETHDIESGIVSLTKKQFDAINIQLGDIEQKSMTGYFRTTGFLKVPPQNKANITAAIGGTVQTILVQAGDAVEKDQTLAVLTNPEFIKLQQEYLDTESQLSFSKKDYERQKELSEKNVTAVKSLQQVESNFRSLNAKFNALKQHLTLLGINPVSLTAENITSEVKIKSPIRGHISHIDISIGSTVEPSRVLMDVVDNSKLHLDLFVYEQDLSKIKIGQKADVMLTNLPGKNYTAEIFAIGSAFEGESKSIPVHATITGNKTGLIEGMSVTANIITGTNLSAAVPTSAIINQGGNDFIFILTDNHDHPHGEKHDENTEAHNDFTFQKLSVKKGTTNGMFSEITFLQEIHDTPKVVISGSFYLMSMISNPPGIMGTDTSN